MSATSTGRRVGGAEPPAGEVVSTTLRICREHWKTLAIYGLLAGAPVAALDAAIALERNIDPFATPLTLTGDPAATDRDSLGSALLALVLYGWASAATVHTVAAARDGRFIGWREGLRTGLRRLGGVVAASFIVLVLVILGLLALVLPGLWIAVALALTTPALVLEGLSPLAAVRRSYTLVQGRWWRTAGVVALGVLLVFAALLLVAVPAGILAATTDNRGVRALIAGVANALSTGAVVPLTVGLFTVLFLERRGATGSPGDRADEERYRGFAPPVPAEPVEAPEGWRAPEAPGRPVDLDRPADPPGRSAAFDRPPDSSGRASDADRPPDASKPPREPPPDASEQPREPSPPAG
jgi:hypothetical protein